jgi:hypothetical protein
MVLLIRCTVSQLTSGLDHITRPLLWQRVESHQYHCHGAPTTSASMKAGETLQYMRKTVQESRVSQHPAHSTSRDQQTHAQRELL